MAGRQSSAVENALAEYRATGAKRANVYRIAATHGIAATSLYRALAKIGKGRHRKNQSNRRSP